MTSEQNSILDKLHAQGLRDVRCPFCGGEINRKWFWEVLGGSAFFVCECWSGDVYNPNHEHIFLVSFTLPETIHIDAIEDEDGKSTMGRKIRD